MTTGAGEGGREALQPPRAPARAFGDIGDVTVPGPRARELRAGPARRARRRRDPRARLPDRRRLRLLGGVVRAAAAARPARGRGGLARTGSRPSSADERASLRGVDRPGEAARRAIGADLGAVFDRAGERLFLVDEQGHEIAGRADAAAVPAPARRRTGSAARSRSRSPSRAASRRSSTGSGLEVVRTPAALGRADARGGRGRRRLRGRGRRRLRLPGVPARLRRGREPLQAARAARAGQTGRSRSSSPSCRAHARPPAACRARGRSRAWSCACSPSG